MSNHIIPYDHFNHIEDVSCGCNPTISIAEGEEIYIHKEVIENKSFKNYINNTPAIDLYNEYMNDWREITWGQFVASLLQNGTINLERAMQLLCLKQF